MARFLDMIKRKLGLKKAESGDMVDTRNRDSQAQYEVKKAPRSYDEIELPDENEQNAQNTQQTDVDPQEQFKVKKQPRSYEEITLDNEGTPGDTDRQGAAELK